MIRGSAAEVFADDGYAAWLRYAPLAEPPASVPLRLVPLTEGLLVESALRELRVGLTHMFGQTPAIGRDLGSPSILVSVRESDPPDAYRICRQGEHIHIEGSTPRGALYGAFTLLRQLALGESFEVSERPSAPIRFLNHWDNPDGSIERGYAGRSILYRDGDETFGITADLDRVGDYARLLASIGINGCSLNNVNAHPWVISDQGLPQVAQLAESFRNYGVQTLLSVRFDSPVQLGGLPSYDPLRPEVAGWWCDKVEEIYRHIPDLIGLVIKADSEGEAGPSADGRTHADAANMLARGLAPHQGILFYRGFVYNHRMDWRDPSLDRAKAQYDNFKPLDGKFEPNVILQIKNGPIDFQVREPASPTFIALENTNTAIELMITQEYLGQQLHTVYEAPWWKDTLDFNYGLPDRPSRVADVVTGKTFPREHFGFVAVCGVGRDRNWLGNHLAQVNLYAYGRLAWNPELTSEAIAQEWVRLTFGLDPNVVETVTDLLMRSWPAYEDYTGNLGIGGLTDIIHIHYGPSPLSSEHNGWGQWHRSDAQGTGMDRTVTTGTGMAGQYPTTKFESLATCPEELLLFFHHVPYSHRLRNGSTVIQHLYDRHYEGAEEVARFVQMWQGLRGQIDGKRFFEVLHQLEYQAGHALVWRDAICHWFSQLSGVADERGRVFHEPNRVEAETMDLSGYQVIGIDPWEAASGGRGIALCAEQGSARCEWLGATGTYDLSVWYFDLQGERAHFGVQVDGFCVDSWSSTGRFPSCKCDGHSKTRRVIRGIELQRGSAIVLLGQSYQSDRAAYDFLEILPVQ